MKALKPYSSFFCLAHRLNNILKHAFYQTSSKRKKANSSTSAEPSSTGAEGGGDDDEESDDDDEPNSVAAIADKVPDDALLVLQTICDCKQLVKYVKKVRRFFPITYPFQSSL